MSQAWDLTAGRQAERRPLPLTKQRVSLVTGGTDGIGRAVALELARGGDRVIFVGRDTRRGAEVLAALRYLAPGAEHQFLPADLSLLSETERVAEQVTRATPQLHAAVFCAGILSTIPEWTAENLERSFALNYLSRYLLAQRLLPLLQAALSARLVLVSNAGKYPDTLDFEDLQHRRGKPGLGVSGRTQFANDLLAIELAERVRATGVEVSCVFPGVTRSACFRNAVGLPWLVRLLAPVALQLFAQSPQAAAQTPVFLAREAAATGSNGRFYGPRSKPRDVPERARNPERRAALWNASAELVRATLGTRLTLPGRAT
jgi:NAD(P)-dependent dehydrogenase (short-subunit alcohol dehydrogenase family)